MTSIAEASKTNFDELWVSERARGSPRPSDEPLSHWICSSIALSAITRSPARWRWIAPRTRHEFPAASAWRTSLLSSTTFQNPLTFTATGLMLAKPLISEARTRSVSPFLPPFCPSLLFFAVWYFLILYCALHSFDKPVDLRQERCLLPFLN